MSQGEIILPTGDQAGVPDPLVLWRAELDRHDPRSHEYHELARALADLAGELGVGKVAGEPEADAEPLPPGFVSVSRPTVPAEIPVEQFWHRVPPLYKARQPYVTPIEEWTTDAEGRVRVVDLRPELVHQTKGISPAAEEAAHVDGYFFTDMKTYAETGIPRNTVKQLGGGCGAVFYTKVNGSKTRVYWAPIATRNYSGDDVHVVARIADSGDSTGYERALYRRVFGVILRHP